MTPQATGKTRPGNDLPSTARRRRLLFHGLQLLLIYLFVEVLAAAGLLFLDRFRDIRYAPQISTLSEHQRDTLRFYLDQEGGKYGEQHPVLGWTVKANGEDGVYRSNSGGMRNSRDFDLVPPDGVIRLSTYGDSFTHGSDVGNDETWQEQLMAMDDTIEVLNFGVGAYGFDQAYLRYVENGVAWGSHIVVMGFMAENIYRNVNVFRGFYSTMYGSIFTKPRFVLEDGELNLLDNPLSTHADYERFLADESSVLAEIGEHDHHYHMTYHPGALDFLPSVRFVKIFVSIFKTNMGPCAVVKNGAYNTGSEAYQVTIRIFERFRDDALAAGSLPVALIYPDLFDQYRYREDRSRRYQPLLDHLQAAGMRTIDVLDALEPYEDELTVEELIIQPWGHFSGTGNRIIAEAVRDYVIASELDTPEGVARALVAERKRAAAGARP